MSQADKSADPPLGRRQSMEDDDEPEASADGMTRRTLLRRSGTAAAGAATVGAGAHRFDLDPVQEADALLPAAAGIALGVGAYMAINQDDHDTQAVMGAIQFEDHLQAYNRFREWWEVENEVQLASFENDLNNLHDQLLNNGIRTLYEQALEGNEESSAISTAKEDMDGDADEVAEWIVSWWNARIQSSAVSKAVDLTVIEGRDDSGSEVISNGPQVRSDMDYSLPGTANSVSMSSLSDEVGDRITLSDANGNLVTIGEENQVGDSGANEYCWSNVWVLEPDPDNYSFDAEEYDGPEDFDSWEHVDGDQQGLDAGRYIDLLSKIEDKLATAKTDLDAVASDHFTAIQEGDVTLDELMAPGGLLDTAADADTAHGAALYFRAQNMPHTDGLRIEADNPDTGETVTLEGYLGWSVAEDGDTLPVGESIDPESYLGSIYFATQYENDDGNMTGDVIEFVELFTIVSSNEEGDSVTFESPDSLPDADTSPDETIDIFRENRDSEQDARDQTIEVVVEETSDGGGGFSFGGSGFSIPVLLGKIAGFPIWLIALVVAFIYNSLNN